MLVFEPPRRVHEAGLNTPLATAFFLPTSDHTVTLIQYGQSISVTMHISEGAPVQLGPLQPHPAERVILGEEGDGNSLLLDVYEAVLTQAQNSQAIGVTTYLSSGGQAFHQTVALAAEHPSGHIHLYVSNTQGLEIYQITDTEPLRFVGHVQDTEDSYTADTSCMIRVVIQGRNFLITGSMSEHGLNVYDIDSNSLPVLVGTVGVEELLPISGVCALIPIEVAGRVFLVAAATASSSLTVLELQPDGTLTPTDHLLDTRDTRFEGVTHLTAFEHDDHHFVLAAGQDDGLSLFVLLPDGQLIHLQSLADSTESSLENISALSVQVVGTEAQVFVLSAAESGLTQLTFDLSDLGVVLGQTSGTLLGTEGQDVLCLEAGGSLLGGAGNDILRDGQGENTLTGGTGRDVFVFVADGDTDVVTDFNPGQDRLDLSLIPQLYDISQLVVISQSYGATLQFGAEVWQIHTAGDTPLTAAHLSDIGNGHRVVVTLGPAVPPLPGTTHIGNATADMIRAGAGSDTLLGMEGNDTLIGGLGNDSLDGGHGQDTAVIDAMLSEVVVTELPNGLVQITSTDGTDLFNNIELFQFSDSTVSRSVLLGHNIPTDGPDTLEGSPDADILDGLAGNDLITGQQGADTLLGNEGNDTLFGGDGDDTVSGGTGQDLLRGGGGADALTGELGADRLFGDRGEDTLMGGYGTDALYGGYDNDFLRGGGGADTLNGELGSDTLFGDRANDQLFGGNGADFLYGGYEHDLMRGGGQNDELHGELGNDLLFGDRGNDRLFGGNNEDELYGGYDNDLLHGGANRDTLNGELGNDTLHGDRGNDRVLGGHGDDHIYGGFDHDFVHGGAGNDVLNGGFGNDTLGGGLGRDTFIFANGFGTDVITDLEAALGEVIDFSRLGSITSMTDLIDSHATQVGADVVITDLHGNMLTLRDVTLDTLTTDNFLF